MTDTLLHQAFTTVNSQVLSVELETQKCSDNNVDYAYLSVLLLDEYGNRFIWETPVVKKEKVKSMSYFDLVYTFDTYDNCIHVGDSLILAGDLDRSHPIPTMSMTILSILVPKNNY